MELSKDSTLLPKKQTIPSEKILPICARTGAGSADLGANRCVTLLVKSSNKNGEKWSALSI